MTRAIDLPHGTWCTGLPNYAAGALPWSGTSTVNNPAYNYFTPGVPIAAQEMNSLLADVSQAYNALVTWIAPSATLAVPSDLTALTAAIAEGETRYVPGYGIYVYHASGSGNANDNVYYVVGHLGGGTQWALDGYANSGRRFLINFVTTTYAGTAKALTGSFDTTDPAARNGGNVGRLVCQAGTFTCAKGDFFEIEYSVPITLVAGAQSDVVTGVRYSAGNYIAASIDTSAQVTGSPANGVLYTSFASGSDLRILITRTCYWSATAAGTFTFQLDAACDAQAHGSVIQGAQLVVKQWRGQTTY